jgi:hypothetical protein
MRREPVVGPMSRWQPWRWVLADVQVTQAPHDVQGPAAAPAAPVLAQAASGVALPEGSQLWLHAGHRVELFRDDAEGYFLNLESPQPCFWVFWRADDERLVDGEPMAVPQIVTLSYHDAGRWLDAQEKVDQVPAPAVVVDWLRDFVNEHYVPETKRRKRPESFKPLTDRFGQPARVSTDKPGRGPAHG